MSENTTRSDTIAFRVTERLDEGKRIRGVFARAGVQRYDGGLRVLRAPDELFSKATVASFVGVPVTLQHGGPVVGRVSEVKPMGGTHLGGTVEIDDMHRDAVDNAPPFFSAEWRSAEYPADPALADVYGPHDRVARDVSFQALAIGVGAPRCGNSCSRLDCETCGGSCETEDNMSTKAPATAPTIESLTAERDAALGQLAAIQAANKEDAAVATKTAEQIADEVKQRIALIRRVAPHVSSHVKLDGLSPAELMKVGVRAVRPDLDVENKSDAFVSGCFDALVPTLDALPSAIARARRVVGEDRFDETDEQHIDSPEAARELMQRRYAATFVPPTGRRLDQRPGESPRQAMQRRLAEQFKKPHAAARK